MLATLVLAPLALAETSAEYIQKNAVPFAPGALPSSLLKIFENKKLVLLGEMHGTAEMPY